MQIPIAVLIVEMTMWCEKNVYDSSTVALTYQIMNKILDEMPNNGISHCHHHKCSHEEVEYRLGQRDSIPRRGFVLLVKLVIV